MLWAITYVKDGTTKVLSCEFESNCDCQTDVMEEFHKEYGWDCRVKTMKLHCYG